MESFCDGYDCDCHIVCLHVFARGKGEKALATIEYGWESASFYAKKLGKPKDSYMVFQLLEGDLDVNGPMTPVSKTLLEHFRLTLLTDPEYKSSLADRYRRFRATLHGPTDLFAPFKPSPNYSIASKVGRNDPCTCGSGKKYKKCCG